MSRALLSSRSKSEKYFSILCSISATAFFSNIFSFLRALRAYLFKCAAVALAPAAFYLSPHLCIEVWGFTKKLKKLKKLL